MQGSGHDLACEQNAALRSGRRVPLCGARGQRTCYCSTTFMGAHTRARVSAAARRSTQIIMLRTKQRAPSRNGALMMRPALATIHICS